jgi:hypothetical protein
MKERGYSRESTLKKVVALTSEERKDIKSCVLLWNERFQALEAHLEFVSGGSARFSWDFDAKVQRAKAHIVPQRLNRLSGYDDKYVLTDRPVDIEEKKKGK